MKTINGFITIATGKDIYFQIAVNLLRSYRYFAKERLPFAIITDRENDYTAEFDDVFLLKNATCSYLDKLELFDYLPYDTSIFIDADCLAYDDLNEFFRYFEDADDFCCFGRVLPLDDKTGWFEYENMGDLQSRIDYIVGLHGGIYYMRKTDACRKAFADAKRFAQNYSEYGFKGKFSTPGDEPVLALSMAVNHYKPIPFPADAMTVFWEHEHDMRLDLKSGCAEIRSAHQNVRLLHWGTRFCRTPIYQKQVAQLDLIRNGKQCHQLLMSDIKYDVISAVRRAGSFEKWAKNKIMRIIK